MKVASEESPLLKKLHVSRQKSKDPKETPEHEESDQGKAGITLFTVVFFTFFFSISTEDDDILVSGWGGKDEEDLRDDLLKLWSDMLEKWDGRDKWDPKGEKTRSRQLVKLVRKVIN